MNSVSRLYSTSSNNLMLHTSRMNISFSLKSGQISADPELCKSDAGCKSISCTEGYTLIWLSNLEVSPDFIVFNILNNTDGQAQCLQSIENVSEADPYYSCSKEFTVSSRINIHEHTEHKKGRFIASLNISGFRRHLDEISSSLGEKGIHLLALNETKVDNSYAKQLTNILGYQQERKDRTAHEGGVALYIREPIQ